MHRSLLRVRAECRETSALMSDKSATLAELSVAAAAFDTARRSLAEEVERARRAGASWSEIGHALGMTRQGAFQRFGAVRQRHDDPELNSGDGRPPSAPS
jgi:hypothetical protein